MAVDKEDVLARIRQVLAENQVMNLATEGEGGPWCATCYFVEDGFDLLCLLEDRGQTMANVRRRPRVAFSINRQVPDRFLQGWGVATVVGLPRDHPELFERMCRKVPQLRQFVEAVPGLLIVRIVTEALSLSDLSAGIFPRLTLRRRGREWLLPHEARRPPRALAWALAPRPWSFPASLVPMLVGGALAYRDGFWDPVLFLLTLVGGLLVHIGANLLNTYFDFRRGVDVASHADDRTLVDGVLRPSQVLVAGLAALAAGGGLGGYLVSQSTPGLLAVGGVGMALALFYTADPWGYKYRALGDLGIFAAFGPLLVVGTYMVQKGGLGLWPFLLAVPLGLIIDAILHANNLRDVAADRAVGARTLAQLLGERGSQALYALLVLGPYGLVAAFGALLSPWALLPLLSLPLAFRLVQRVKVREALALLPQLTAQLTMVFGLLLATGILISSWL